MRYLHRVAASEKFIARGVYRFYEGDTLLPESQAWTRHQLAGGGILTRIDHTGYDESQYTTLVEYLTDETGRVERLSLRQWPSANTGIRALRAEYVFFPAYVQASRRVNDEETLHVEQPLPTSRVFVEWADFAPLYWGESLRYALERPEDVSVFFPTWAGIPAFPGKVRLNAHRIIENQTEGQVSSDRKETPPIKYYLKGDHVIVLDSHYIPLSIEHLSYKRTILTEYAHI